MQIVPGAEAPMTRSEVAGSCLVRDRIELARAEWEPLAGRPETPRAPATWQDATLSTPVH